MIVFDRRGLTWSEYKVVLKTYQRALRADPCAYCGGTGGTIDHIIPRRVTGEKRKRGSTLNWTGACRECNRRKDKDRSRTLLEQLLAVQENEWRARKQAIRRVGAVVSGPFFERGTVISVKPFLIEIPGRDEPWHCRSWWCLSEAA